MPPSGGGGFYEKFFFAAIIAISLLFTACNAPTEVKTLSSNGIESSATYTFTDFFNSELLVQASRDETSTAILMDKNTGVLYIYKRSGYQYGISPIYDSDGTVLTKEKWLAKHSN